jgi:uncharacterized protein (DUF1810 family)
MTLIAAPSDAEPRTAPGDAAVPDPDLSRFAKAQDAVYPQVLAELRACRKATHWMWFVFPQIAGLGHSDMARRYALQDAAEARAYLADPVLGARLREAVGLLLNCSSNSATQVLGSPDDLKLRSCLTLFQAAATSDEDSALFAAALAKFFQGKPDAATLDILEPRRRP